MKRFIMSIFVLLTVVLASNAQKFAMLDMDYIMKNIPQFESATEQINQLSKKWQS